jgi:hypothetical protein
MTNLDLFAFVWEDDIGRSLATNPDLSAEITPTPATYSDGQLELAAHPPSDVYCSPMNDPGGCFQEESSRFEPKCPYEHGASLSLPMFRIVETFTEYAL